MPVIPVIQSLITIFLFVLVLGVLVLVHELGHFLTARAAKVRVLEFGIGFPPRSAIRCDIGRAAPDRATRHPRCDSHGRRTLRKPVRRLAFRTR